MGAESERLEIGFWVQTVMQKIKIKLWRNVAEADAQLLHPFDATNTGRQIGAEKTAVGCFVGEPAHGAKTQIDGSWGELTGFEMRAIAQDHNPVEGQARFRTIPVNELIDGVTIAPLCVCRVKGCSILRPWRVPGRATEGRIWCYCVFFRNLASASDRWPPCHRSMPSLALHWALSHSWQPRLPASGWKFGPDPSRSPRPTSPDSEHRQLAEC